MSKYDGPSYKKNQKRLKKSEFPFYRDSAHVTEKDGLFDKTKTSKYEKSIKITREMNTNGSEKSFSEQINKTNDERKRLIPTKQDNGNSNESSEKDNSNDLFKRDTAIYQKRRSSTPFKVQKIPSPYHGLSKTFRKGITVDYSELAISLKKEEEDFILSYDHLCERLSKLYTKEAESTFEEPADSDQSVSLDNSKNKLNQSLETMIEEQDSQINHHKIGTNDFNDEDILEDSKKIKVPNDVLTDKPVGLNSNEDLDTSKENNNQLIKKNVQLGPVVTRKRKIVTDEEIELLELKAALSRFNYIEKNSSKEKRLFETKEITLKSNHSTQQTEINQKIETNKDNEQEDLSEEKEQQKKDHLINDRLVPESISELERLTERSKDEKNNVLLSTDSAKLSLDGHKQLNEYKFPSLDLLDPPVEFQSNAIDDWVLGQAELLNETLDAFNVLAQVVGWTVGPAVTQFELQLSRGVKVNKITNLSDDLKLALAAKDIRIEAPIPGKSTVGVEIPNRISRPVMLSEVMASDKFKNSPSPLTVALGVNLAGDAIVSTLDKMPHGLIAGATGSGKSVFINSILVSLLYKANPSEVKLILIDPKAVELAPYNAIPHLLSPVISEPKAASEALKWAVNEMEERYQKLALAGVRNIQRFNEKVQEQGDHGLKLPYIVIIIDELADLMMVASSDVQDSIVRITQKARAAGIHLLVATQRPSVDVITGTIKNNIPTRIAFMVSSQVDSRTIMDSGGAEKLLGRGDMLFLENGASQPIRIQGTYVEKEIDSIVKYVKEQRQTNYLFEPESLLARVEAIETKDELYEEIVVFIIEEGQVSASSLQRKFKIGFNRASNIVDTLEKEGLISSNKGSKPRDVFITKTDYKERNETKELF
ncbi:DNA translocase FtsK [Carnobacterium sp. TMP28]|uniref:DNA translocase FtsK n=1 Tax=Carnobacterium sp. TMP28 TaxID=3397060 RepID=UPI0039E14E52